MSLNITLHRIIEHGSQQWTEIYNSSVSEDIWDNTIWHQTAVAVPVLAIFHAAVGVISQAAMRQKYSEVDWVEVWQNVIETWPHTMHKQTNEV